MNADLHEFCFPLLLIRGNPRQSAVKKLLFVVCHLPFAIREWFFIPENSDETNEMMPLDVVFKYGLAPTVQVLRGLDTARDVYGIRKLSFDEKERTVRVEYDGTRLHPDTVAALLRRAGLDLKERVVLV